MQLTGTKEDSFVVGVVSSSLTSDITSSFMSEDSSDFVIETGYSFAENTYKCGEEHLYILIFSRSPQHANIYDTITIQLTIIKRLKFKRRDDLDYIHIVIFCMDGLNEHIKGHQIK